MMLQQMADRIAIEWLAAEYCRTLDLMDLDALAALFTADCVVEYGPADMMRSKGSANLRQSLERMWRYTRTAHHLANVQIHFESEDAATMTSALTAWHEGPDGDSWTLYGRYDDQVIRADGHWRFARRRLSVVGNGGGAAPNLNRFFRNPPPPGWNRPSEAALGGR
jgi:ketosteroid isomerase-like protein